MSHADLLREIRAKVLTLRGELEGIRDAISEAQPPHRSLHYIKHAIEGLTFASAMSYEAARELK